MNESERTAQVLKRFRELYPDGIAWKFNDRIGRSRPDAMFLHNTLSFVEFKMPGNALTAGQRLELERIKTLGYTALVGFFLGQGKIRVETVTGIVLRVLTIDEFCHFVA